MAFVLVNGTMFRPPSTIVNCIVTCHAEQN
jgi:hypothetical protein